MTHSSTSVNLLLGGPKKKTQNRIHKHQNRSLYRTKQAGIHGQVKLAWGCVVCVVREFCFFLANPPPCLTRQRPPAQSPQSASANVPSIARSAFWHGYCVGKIRQRKNARAFRVLRRFASMAGFTLLLLHTHTRARLFASTCFRTLNVRCCIIPFHPFLLPFHPAHPCLSVCVLQLTPHRLCTDTHTRAASLPR